MINDHTGPRDNRDLRRLLEDAHIPSHQNIGQPLTFLRIWLLHDDECVLPKLVRLRTERMFLAVIRRKLQLIEPRATNRESNALVEQCKNTIQVKNTKENRNTIKV